MATENKLYLETSPYLLQHADNPVYWQAWNENSLTEAKKENKLLIISIGYSACHWCHVMEHESFEDYAVAKVMNEHFISIKVDREERPDVDAVYMKAVQVMTKQGGWPLNVVALPDGRPIWGGTYFIKTDWIESLTLLQELYNTNPEKIYDYAEKLHKGLKEIALINTNGIEESLDQEKIDILVEKWSKSFDWEYGGSAKAPKFMMPNNYLFLMRYGFQKQNKKILNFVDLTLTKMGYGGIFDTVGGGFSRYSVDMKWHIPHFEKMLYDNGQLVSLYSEAYKRTGNSLYKTIIEKTLSFVSKELTNNKGGFYSALDADSLNMKNHLEEGAFYVWTSDELRNILKEDYTLFSELFNINDFGLWENHNYVLIQNKSLETISDTTGISVIELESKKKNWEAILFKKRKKRKHPRLDDKCLTSWNAIMLKGYIDAYKAIGNKKYLTAALKNAHFILDNLWTHNGNLLHNYKDGKSTINGYLEDYAFTIDAFIALYEVTLDERWLQQAKQLTDYCFEYFYDEKNIFFSFTSHLDTALITKHFEIEDNVIPASNSVMANNLFKLSIYFHNPFYETVFIKMLRVCILEIDYPSAFSNWLTVFLNLSEQNKEIAVCGEESLKYINLLNKEYLPYVVLSGSNKESTLPFLKNRFTKNKTLFFICQNRNCNLPFTTFNEALIQLKK